MHGAARGWRLALERHLRASGLSFAGWSAVVAAAASPDPLSQTELAQQLGVEGATLVATIDKLVDAGMVERMPCAKDRRVRLIVVTGKGQEMSRLVEEEAAALRISLLRNLDTERVAQATEVLELLQRQFDEGMP